MNLTVNLNHKVSGQIMLISLMVLTILAIIIVGLVSVVVKDTQQTVANEEYERLYAIAEAQLLQLIDKYADSAVSLSDLLIDYPSQCSNVSANKYRCIFDNGTVETRMDFSESPDVNDYELNKDESLVLQLNGYRGNVSLAWQGDTALEFSLIYLDGTNQKAINDIFDKVGVFDSTGNDPLFDSPPENHPFPFENDPSRAGWIRFNLGSVTGLPATATTLGLRIIARQDSGSNSVTQLSMSGGVGFPNQVREIVASSFDPMKQVDVVASVGTQIPLEEQVLPIFTYSLGTQGAVAK